MPAGQANLASTVFRYITVDDLRAENITEEQLTCDRAYSLIEFAGSMINVITKQWFLPIRARQRVDGRQAAVVHHPLMLPIQDFFGIRYFKEGLVDIVLPSIAYQVKERYVQMMDWKAKFPTTPYFVLLDGVFGVLEDDFYVKRTKTTADVAVGASEIRVDSLEGISFGDTLWVGDTVERGAGPVVVSGIDTANSSILCDPIRFSCASGSTVARYGKVPSMIKRAAILIVKDRATPIGEEGSCDDKNVPMWYVRRLQNESVEGYSYSLAQLPAPYGFGGGAWTTGNPEADDILQMWANPMMYIGNQG